MNTLRILSILLSFCALTSCQETTEKLINKAVALADKGKYEEAIKIYTMVIDKNDNIQLAYLNRGLCYVSLGDYHKSIVDFYQIINLKTLGTGNIVFNLNKNLPIEEAKYQVAYEDGIYGRAQARYYLDSLDSSYDDFQELIARNYSEKVYCILFQADIWHETGNDSVACSFVKRARKISKTNDETKECNESFKAYCK